MLTEEATEQLILVDEADNVIAPADKFAAHRAGQLHRAFSVFIFTSDGRVLLQKRAPVKYHSAGKWGNTCCGHPRPGEPVLAAAERRLQEETGLVCTLEDGFTARYCAELDNGMIENELVHVVFGQSDDPGWCNPAEVSAYTYMTLDELGRDIEAAPEKYAVWLVTYFATHAAKLETARSRFAARGRAGETPPPPARGTTKQD